ncbi:hypothetical protein VITU9109_13656 [Vibrio tubiashii ATCC 19109]|uniref:Uncharacterized protein n=1 Tax=Vibrio tubiashii ATCC 19109 TaxID=1051646 RepID=A0ABN0DFM9_9VIBR|nr:hypothetical protein VITU9109_13656 [Vibrio tubiashii ATCC 19109]
MLTTLTVAIAAIAVAMIDFFIMDTFCGCAW